MLDWLLKPKFYTKCNSCVKLIKMRLEMILNKRNAVLKFLKKDIADLLSSDHDYKAYERAEALLIEQNKLSCYELVANFVGCISDHLEHLYKRRDCLDECKEAISSLTYAAARFSDLPELRELRTLFSEKFGNSLEPYISKEFVEKLRRDPPSKELSIQLLHDLAEEFSIEWHSKTLEQRFFSQPLSEEPKHDPLNDYDDAKEHKNNDFAIPKIEDMSKGYERNILSQERSWKLQSSSDETTAEYSTQDGSKACSSSLESVSEDELEIKRPFSIKLVPTPYVQEKLNRGENNFKKTTESEALNEEESNHDLREPVVQRNQIPRSVRQRPLKPPPGNDNVSDSKTSVTIAKLDSSGMKSEKAKEEGDLRDSEERMMDELLMHYSKKQSPYESGIGKAKEKGDLRDSEERMMDELLMHYSKKQFPYESGIGKANKNAYPSLQGHDNMQETRHAKSYLGVPDLRATSLPPEETVSKQTLKGHARATSFEPQMLRVPAHVHPSLPDYDELRASLTALRGR